MMKSRQIEMRMSELVTQYNLTGNVILGKSIVELIEVTKNEIALLQPRKGDDVVDIELMALDDYLVRMNNFMDNHPELKNVVPKPQIIEEVIIDDDTVQVNNVVDNKSYKIGMPSDKESISNKQLHTYTNMIVQSNYNPDDKSDDRRYLYHNKLDKEVMAKNMKVSKRQINKNISTLKKSGLVDAINTENGVVYKFNYKKDNKYFVEIENDILKELCLVNANVIATYILFKYHLRNGSKKMSREYIAEEIGLSKSSVKTVSQITKILAKLGLIYMYKKKERTTTVASNGAVMEILQDVIYYELATYEEWLERDRNIMQIKEK